MSVIIKVSGSGKLVIKHLSRGTTRRVLTLIEWMESNPHAWNNIKEFVYRNKMNKKDYKPKRGRKPKEKK